VVAVGRWVFCGGKEMAGTGCGDLREGSGGGRDCCCCGGDTTGGRGGGTGGGTGRRPDCDEELAVNSSPDLVPSVRMTGGDSLRNGGTLGGGSPKGDWTIRFSCALSETGSNEIGSDLAATGIGETVSEDVVIGLGEAGLEGEDDAKRAARLATLVELDEAEFPGGVEPLRGLRLPLGLEGGGGGGGRRRCAETGRVGASGASSPEVSAASDTSRLDPWRVPFSCEGEGALDVGAEATLDVGTLGVASWTFSVLPLLLLTSLFAPWSLGFVGCCGAPDWRAMASNRDLSEDTPTCSTPSSPGLCDMAQMAAQALLGTVRQDGGARAPTSALGCSADAIDEIQMMRVSVHKERYMATGSFRCIPRRGICICQLQPLHGPHRLSRPAAASAPRRRRWCRDRASAASTIQCPPETRRHQMDPLPACPSRTRQVPHEAAR
jgi:hypothetical protein